MAVGVKQLLWVFFLFKTCCLTLGIFQSEFIIEKMALQVGSWVGSTSCKHDIDMLLLHEVVLSKQLFIYTTRRYGATIAFIHSSPDVC